jgi:hypothetical protein
MSTWTGVLVAAPLGAAAALGMQSLWDNGRPEFYAPTTEVTVTALAIGVPASGQPSPEAMAVQVGAHAGAFSDDYYHRIYLQPTRIEFGNLVTQSTRTVEVWNAFPDPVTIDVLVGDTTGLAVGFEPPQRLHGLEDIFYPVTATLDGPSFVDTTLTLHFSQGGERSVAISYGRVLVFGLAPNWASGLTERIEWLTDVMTMRDGGEQRVRLRVDPRRSFEYEVWEHGADVGLIDLLLCAWQARIYAVPVWTDRGWLIAPVPAGSTQIAIDTVNHDYHAGGLAIVGVGARRTEALEIASTAQGSITLKRATTQAWPAGAWIAPARLGRLPSRQAITRPSAALSLARLRFDLDDLTSSVGTLDAASYRGADVLVRRPNRIEDITAEYLRLLDVFDNDTGLPVVTDIPNRPYVVRSHQYLLRDRNDIAAMRAWLSARAGRQAPFWMPTWERNFEIASPDAIDALSLLIVSQGFATYFQNLPGRQDIALLHRDGTWYFRHVTAFEYAGGVLERIVIDEALGRACQPDDFALCCFLELARLDSDAVELFFETDSIARLTLAARSVDA